MQKSLVSFFLYSFPVESRKLQVVSLAPAGYTGEWKVPMAWELTPNRRLSLVGSLEPGPTTDCTLRGLRVSPRSQKVLYQGLKICLNLGL